MIGSVPDIINRLMAVLPKRWFAEQTPNLTSILRSIATPWAWLYGVTNYVILQTRISTATDSWLDFVSLDYFGDKLNRRADESDSNYRKRISAALLREAATRSAVSAGLEALVGSKPTIFEPAKPMDTGSYGPQSLGSATNGTGLAYGVTGGWGSLDLPLQMFITTVRPPSAGISMLAGYGTPAGGYGEGMISYIDLELLPGHVSDQDIRSTLCSLLPINAIAWLRIS
jgi:hypothetical protein